MSDTNERPEELVSKHADPKDGVRAELAAAKADCERWSAAYAKQADELIALKASLGFVNDENAILRDKLAAIEQSLPSTFYADRELAERVQFLADKWRLGMKLVKEMDAAEALLREVAACGIWYTANTYHEVQIPKVVWDQIKALVAKEPTSENDCPENPASPPVP